MKKINCNGWLSSNWGPHMSISKSITDPAILANGDNLYYTWFYEIIIGAYTLELDKLYFSIDLFYVSIMLFYYRLTLLAEDNFYEDS